MRLRQATRESRLTVEVLSWKQGAFGGLITLSAIYLAGIKNGGKKKPLFGALLKCFLFFLYQWAGVIFLLQPWFFLPDAPLSVLRSVGAT
jgi:hypothetical protein